MENEPPFSDAELQGWAASPAALRASAAAAASAGEASATVRTGMGLDGEPFGAAGTATGFVGATSSDRPSVDSPAPIVIALPSGTGPNRWRKKPLTPAEALVQQVDVACGDRMVPLAPQAPRGRRGRGGRAPPVRTHLPPLQPRRQERPRCRARGRESLAPQTAQWALQSGAGSRLMAVPPVPIQSIAHGRTLAAGTSNPTRQGVYRESAQFKFCILKPQ